MHGKPSFLQNAARMGIPLLLLCSVVFAGCRRTGTSPAPSEGPRASPPVALHSEVDPAEAGIGEPITFRITLEAEPNIPVALPEVGGRIQGFRIVDMGKEGPKQREGRSWSQRWYRLEADLAGSYVLPGVSLAYTDAEGRDQRAEAGQLFVEVKSALREATDAQDIRDIKPLEKAKREIPRSWIFLLAGGLILLGLLTGMFFHLRSRRRTEQTQRTPEELARDELETLEATGLLEEQRYREYVFGLSLIFRRYLERRFSLPAAEQTTEEIFVSMRNSERLDKALKEQARSFLEETDPIKYRGLEPRAAETETWRGRLIAFMERAAETKNIQEAA